MDSNEARARELLTKAVDPSTSIYSSFVSCDDAIRAITAALSQQIPPGWKLVPVDLTSKQMVSAGNVDLAWSEIGAEETLSDDELRALYAAMLAAAPQPATEPQP